MFGVPLYFGVVNSRIGTAFAFEAVGRRHHLHHGCLFRHYRLGNGGDGSNGSGGHNIAGINRDLGDRHLGGVADVGASVGLVLLRAVARDMADLAALVAGLAGGVERAAVGGGAVTRDMTQLAASVALHGLGLAVAGKVVGAAALVASGGARATGNEATAAAEATVAATGHHGDAATEAGSVRSLAGASQMARLAAVVAAAAGGGTGQPQGRAVRLDVAEALAVVALLGIGRAGQGAAVGLMAGLLAWMWEVRLAICFYSDATFVVTVQLGFVFRLHSQL